MRSAVSFTRRVAQRRWFILSYSAYVIVQHCLVLFIAATGTFGLNFQHYGLSQSTAFIDNIRFVYLIMTILDLFNYEIFT